MAAKKTTKKSAAPAKKKAAAPKKTAAKKTTAAPAKKKTAAPKKAAAPAKKKTAAAAPATKKTAAVAAPAKKKAAAAPAKKAAAAAAPAKKKAAAAAAPAKKKAAAAAPKKTAAAAAPKKTVAAAVAPKKAAAPAPKLPDHAVTAIWARIEGWFAKNHPKLSLGLRPPASAKDIAAAEKTLGVTFPEDFRASLLVHDGQDDTPGVRLVPIAQRLGSLESFVTAWSDDRAAFDAERMEERFEWLSDDERVRQVHFHPKHIPIAGSLFWDYDRLLLDFIPGPSGTVGQVIARDDISFVFLAPSFGALLAKIADGLENGTIVVSHTTYDSELEYRAPNSKKQIREYQYFANP
jgi:cell wall assembly regulator SMI1